MDILLTGKRLEKFVAIQHCLVPRSVQFDEKQKQASKDVVNEFVATKPKMIAFKITLFLILIDFFSIIFFQKMFMSCHQKQQQKVMSFLFDNKIPILRKGFWGINTLAKMGVYSQPSIYSDIGYIQGENRESN